MSSVKRITTFSWFDDRAEEAAGFHAAIFENTKISTVTRAITSSESRSPSASWPLGGRRDFEGRRRHAAC